MSLTAIKLCSCALLKIGANDINSFEDGTVEARIAASLYPLIRDAVLAAHPWSFALSTVDLPSHRRHVFQLPADCLVPVAVNTGDLATFYKTTFRELHVDASTARLTYIRRPDPSEFPPYFVMALVARLAAEFCMPLTEHRDRSERFARLAEEELKLAKLIDGQQATGREAKT